MSNQLGVIAILPKKVKITFGDYFQTVACHGAEHLDSRKINAFPDSQKLNSFPDSRNFGST